MRPAIADGVIYLERAEYGRAELIAVDRATGQLAWHQPFPRARNAVVIGDYLAVVLRSIGIYDRSTGSLARTVTTEPADFSSNVEADGRRLYAGTSKGDVVAVNPATGTEQWRTALGSGVTTMVRGIGLFGDRLGVSLTHFPPERGGADSSIVAVLDRGTGSLIWRRAFATAAADIADPPVPAGSILAAVTSSNVLHAMDMSSGAELWSYDASATHSPYYNPYEANYGLASCDGTILFPGRDHGLISLDAKTGSENWRLPDLGQGDMLSIDCGYGTVLARGAYLTIVDERTGAVVRRVRGTKGLSLFIQSAIRDQSTLYVSTDRGYGAVKLP